MITYGMTKLEAAHDARQDMRALYNKVKGHIKKQEHLHRTQRDRNCLLDTYMNWTSPRGNNWLIVLRTNRKETTLSTMVWYRGRDEKMRGLALSLTGEGAYYLSAHFLERYMERFDPGRDPVKRLGDFFFANHSFSVQAVEELGNGQYKVMAGLMHGLATGYLDGDTGIVSLTTFLDYGLLGEEQLDLAEYLDFKREMATYPRGFREHVERLIEMDQRKAA